MATIIVDRPLAGCGGVAEASRRYRLAKKNPKFDRDNKRYIHAKHETRTNT
jgi:hypothetical protein